MEIQTLRGFERLVVTCCVPLLITIGYMLFLRGATGQIQLSANGSKWRGKATNLAPGALCFLLGAGLGTYVMFSKVGIPSGPTSSTGTNGTVFFVGGEGTAIPQPSVQIRRVLSDYAICFRSATDDAGRDACDKKLGASLKRIPTAQDLEAMEALEKDFLATKNQDALKQVLNIRDQIIQKR